MSNFIIIDLKRQFVENLSDKLRSTETTAVISDDFNTVESLANEVNSKIATETILLVNADCWLKSNAENLYAAVELMFWLRCKFRLKNAVAFYGSSDLVVLLQHSPEYFILSSPGCYYFNLPFSREKIDRILKLKPLEDIYLIKVFLKIKVDSIIAEIRHLLANYIAMALMLNVARDVYEIEEDNQILDPTFTEFYGLKESLEIAILATYFDFTYQHLLLPDDKVRYMVTTSCKVLLIDDLAEKGWGNIISQIIYGKPNSNQLKFLSSEVLSLSSFDNEIPESFAPVQDMILQHKPHLILLDLRLKLETGVQDLESLDGYKILWYLRQSPDFEGIPIIMFTASTNVENIRQLLQNGANYVWTKPGIDEDLSSKEILSRYLSLVNMVKTVVEEASVSGLASLNTYDNSKKLPFEVLRDKLLAKTNYVRYRCKLLELKNKLDDFSDYTDIFIDTNVLMTGIDHKSDKSVDFAKTILNVYKLCQICQPTLHKLNVDGKIVNISTPKILAVNFVLDEIAEMSKLIDWKEGKKWQRALLGYSIIRSVFAAGQVRTEFTNVDHNRVPYWKMEQIESDHYADDQIIELILQLVSRSQFVLSNKTSSFNVNFLTNNINVLLVCDENPKKIKYNADGTIKDNLPRDLMATYNGITGRKGKLTIMRLDKFNSIMEKITL